MKTHLALYHRLAACLGAAAMALPQLAAAAPPTWLPAGDMPHGAVLLHVEELKAIYLECDRLSSATFLDSSTAAHCSLAAEELRRIGFDGRGDAVLAWWRVMVDRRVSGEAAAVKVRSVSL
jgi:hypothetical protein